VAFVDLGSTDAVVAAVGAAKGSPGGLRGRAVAVGAGPLTVEPSRKPVRASGLRAMNVRKRDGGAGLGGGEGGGGGGPRLGSMGPNGAGLVLTGGHFPNSGGLAGGGNPHLQTHGAMRRAAASAASVAEAAARAAEGGGALPCWVVTESCVRESQSAAAAAAAATTAATAGAGATSSGGSEDGSPAPGSPHEGEGALTAAATAPSTTQPSTMSTATATTTTAERRVVAVFLDQESAVACACGLWQHLKSSAEAVGPFTYQEIREDASNGAFHRRLDTETGSEVRAVGVERPAALQPSGAALHECISSRLGQPPPRPGSAATAAAAAATSGSAGSSASAGDALPVLSTLPSAAVSAPPFTPSPRTFSAAHGGLTVAHGGGGGSSATTASAASPSPAEAWPPLHQPLAPVPVKPSGQPSGEPSPSQQAGLGEKAALGRLTPPDFGDADATGADLSVLSLA